MALTLRSSGLAGMPADRHADHVMDVVRSGFHDQTDDVVMRSWSRCLNEYRLHPDKPRRPTVIGRVELDERRARHADVINCARYEMTTLFQQLADSRVSVQTVLEGIAAASAAGLPVKLNTVDRKSVV